MASENTGHRRRQFTCYSCRKEGLWWIPNGTRVQKSETKNFFTPHTCKGDGNYKAKHPYEVRPQEELEAEAKAKLEKLFGS